MQLASTVAGFRLRQFLSLTKPRVVSLIVFCAVIGMYLAAPGWVPPKLLLGATLGIWLVAGAAAAVNCLVEQKIDAVMTRTRARPLPRGEVTSEALLLFLIIFAWTPPHFWALALYRTEDFAKAGLPMLPITHGHRFTRLYVLLYTLILFASALLPFAYGMSGWVYLAAALALNGVFVAYAVRLYVGYSDALARRTFRYSIAYLALLFAALLVDHYFSL